MAGSFVRLSVRDVTGVRMQADCHPTDIPLPDYNVANGSRSLAREWRLTPPILGPNITSGTFDWVQLNQSMGIYVDMSLVHRP